MKSFPAALALWPLFFLLLFCTNFSVPAVYGVQPAALLKNAVFISDTVRAGSFSVITYNIAGLPQGLSSAAGNRAQSTGSIGEKLNAYDICHVQEDFNYNDQLYNSGNAHPYRSGSKGPVLFGDGLNTLSRYPVSELKRVAWTHCTGADCFTPKGFSYSRIAIRRGVFVDFYNVHANAFNHPEAAAARRGNLRQLSEYIRKHSANTAVVIMGDLNAHYTFADDNVHDLIRDNALSDIWVELKCNKKYPVEKDALPASNILDLTDSSETIDKILYRSSAVVQLVPAAYRFEKELFRNEKGSPLSDHHPVSAVFNWKLPELPLLLTQN
ncbi:endonuclease/exonuclease/phosphatase family protein [Dyadobacter sandarakinus]|uniref:Endonuclease n=1 Tax=Dyadobacter sandarakinus TaxID=2747268 RepID=A0ABX7I3S9_9BACT|nr:endonuclease/exonuclease/phosphatase family protein [Dyadobacter sandarakinus]QRQ99897.1 endonuclease [Dyadobacter sandarakinus]